MRILVTGHKGYIGVALVPRLLARGHEVVGVDSDLFARCDYGGAPMVVPEIRKDVRDLGPADLDGFDAVAHLAALSNDPLGDLNPALTDEINHHATIRIARLAKANGVARFAFSSSCSNYGAAGSDWLTEDAAFNPVTPYGVSKVDVEAGLRRLADDDFSPTYLRNATAYGYSCRIRFDLVLNNLVAWAAATGKIFIKSDGTPWRPIVHIEDIARAFVAVLEADRDVVHDQAFNVGRNEDNYQVRDIADIVKEIAPGCEITYAEDGGPDLRSYRVDCSKIRRVLPSFTPGWTARAGAEDLLERLKANKVAIADIEGERYQRVAHIRWLLRSGRLDDTLRERVLA